MKRLVQIILLIVTLTIPCWGDNACADAADKYLPPCCTNLHDCPADTCLPNLSRPEQDSKDRLRHETLAEQPAPLAILSNPQNNYRFGSSRPQRLLPVYGSKQHRLNSKTPLAYKHKSTLRCHYGGRFVQLSTPFQAAAPCDYYVIALRHIVR